MKKLWIEPSAIDALQTESLARRLNVLPLVAQILLRRGLNEETAPDFLRPTAPRFRSYTDLPGAEAAGNRLAEAVKRNERIAVFGDYDVDGISATALMLEFIRSRGGTAEAYLPHRLENGYGLNAPAVQEMAASGAKLLVTVDCGITASTEVALARERGLEVLITDHHEPGAETPQANLVVDPKIGSDPDWKSLAGVGVAFQVVRAAAAALGEKDPEALRRFLDLVALGTIADVVPLVGENRLLVRAGLVVINRSQRIGLAALARAAGLKDKPVTSLDVAFRLGPRLNAAGRLGDARRGLDLLLAHDAEDAQNLAAFLHSQNQERQNLEQAVLAQAEAHIAAAPDLPSVLIAVGKDWPAGVVGLVASRLCDKYGRPSIIFTQEKNLLRGSARSIPGFPLHQVLPGLEGLLQQWGGHELAAGVKLEEGRLDAFAAAMQAEASIRLGAETLAPRLRLEANSEIGELNPRLISELRQFEPFGCQNPRPLLGFKRLKLCLPPRVVGEKHLKFKVTDDRGRYLDAIGFGLGHRAEEAALHNLIDIAGYASENVWNQSTTLQVEIKDFRPSDPNQPRA
ncbi:MAG: single-stranded-DNA-specific exonuclease RecJ [candidate division FCPU426 bacterium]